MVRLLVAGSSQETGSLLEAYLKELGVEIGRGDAVICYGVGTSMRPALNANCGTSKIKRMELMQEAGVRLIPWFRGTDLDKIPKDFSFPALARMSHGFGGTDIVPVFQLEDIPWRVAAGWDWFSSYRAVKTELRVWVWKDEILDIYEKVMKRPEEFKFVGRNFRNGFEFQKVEWNERFHPYHDAVRDAKLAVKSLGLDFGAVDMLVGKDMLVYTLEVNTAPGVIRSGAQETLKKLALRMAEWTLQIEEETK